MQTKAIEQTARAAHEPAVTANALTKHYGKRVAVDALSFELPTGVVAGFIGPNGAGKTTTLAMLLGLVTPSSGAGSVLGHPLGEPDAYLGRVGALVEGPAFWPGLTGRENLRVVAELGGHENGRIPEVLDVVGLTSRADDRFGQYSFGMKQRLGIAAALVGDPTLLLLDEPTNGLDPAGISEMRRLIAGVARDDRTVLVSSHILSELEQVCDWLVVIDDGALVYQGPTGDFLGGAPVVAIASEHAGDLDRLAKLVRLEGFEPALETERILVDAGDRDPREVAVAVNKAAIRDGIVLAELGVRRPTLESHYLAIVEGGKR